MSYTCQLGFLQLVVLCHTIVSKSSYSWWSCVIHLSVSLLTAGGLVSYTCQLVFLQLVVLCLYLSVSLPTAGGLVSTLVS